MPLHTEVRWILCNFFVPSTLVKVQVSLYLPSSLPLLFLFIVRSASLHSILIQNSLFLFLLLNSEIRKIWRRLYEKDILQPSD